MRAFSTILVPEPRLELSAPGLYRIATTVEGEEVFFESSLPLSPGAESFVCAFLLPAMARGARLEVESPLGERFLSNLDFVRRRARQWWPQLSAGGRTSPRAGRSSPRTARPATGAGRPPPTMPGRTTRASGAAGR